MTRIRLITAAAVALSGAVTLAACQPASVEPPPVEAVPSTAVVGTNQTRPLSQEERRQMAVNQAALEQQGVNLRRLFTGEHCAVYEFETPEGRYIFAEGYRTAGAVSSSMACSVAKG